ncbi:MAG: hypothetical protein KBF76_12760 [Verrucomicrobiales bacterium]|nr:hypothetical protein [Verrucomicrobiales bacterium]
MIAALLLAIVDTGSAAESDPKAMWVSVYGWNQTGEKLAASNHWSLALGSFIEAHRQITALAAAYPDFEPDLIRYRLEALEKTIQETEARLSTDEHETMMKYLDFIESLELGESQRYANEFTESLDTLDMALSILDEITASKSSDFSAAVESQRNRLLGHIEWLNSQINFKAASRASVLVDDGVDRGTTRFVTPEQYPNSRDGVFLSGMLFPGSLIEKDRKGVSAIDLIAVPEKGKEAPPAENGLKPDAEAPRRFRMNSKQKSAPETPAEPTAAPP